MSALLSQAEDRASRLAELESRLFFIVGCGRSGTTLLQSILISNPSVSIPPETAFCGAFPDHARGIHDLSDDRQWEKAVKQVWKDQCWREVTTDIETLRDYAKHVPRTWDGLFLALLAAYGERKGRPRVGEKSPLHTRYIDRLSTSFPKARFIHMLRDARAVTLSRLKAGFGTSNIGREVNYWRKAIEMHRAWADRLGERYLLVRYENLVTNLDEQVRELCSFLDLEMTPEMLEPHKRESTGFRNYSKSWMENTLKPVFKDSVEKWRTQLSQTQIAMIEYAVGEEMKEMGYELSGARTSAPGLRLSISRSIGNGAWLARAVRSRSARALGLSGPKVKASASDAKPKR